MTDDFESLFEIEIKYLRPKTENFDRETLALVSLGLDELAVRIYREIKKRREAIPEDITEGLGAPLDTVVDRLDYMYSIGLLDKLGRAYIYDMDLRSAIRTRVFRRIKELLEKIAEIAGEIDNGR